MMVDCKKIPVTILNKRAKNKNDTKTFQSKWFSIKDLKDNKKKLSSDFYEILITKTFTRKLSELL